ncbi:hypothetical protein L9F63_000723, partial [Diploptera punctata]
MKCFDIYLRSYCNCLILISLAIAENELTADLSVMHERRRFRNIGNELPRILSDKTTSLNSLVDSIKFLFSVYTENMIEVFKVPPQR